MAKKSTRRATKGRPRNPEVDRNILVATRELLLEVGGRGISIEAVAKRAQVGKTSIYRRWSGITELVLDAVFLTGDELPEKDDLKEQLEALVEVVVADFRRKETRIALPSVVSECIENPQRVWPTFEPEMELIGKTLQKAQRQGAVRQDVDRQLVFDLYAGAVFMRTLRGGSLSKRFAHQLSEVILRAISSGDD